MALVSVLLGALYYIGRQKRICSMLWEYLNCAKALVLKALDGSLEAARSSGLNRAIPPDHEHGVAYA